MKNWQMKLARLMIGRYGRFDALNKTMLVIAIIGLLIPISWLSLISYLLLILTYYRLFSRKIYVRSAENQKYLAFQKKLFGRFSHQKAAFKDRHTHVYFRCPECKQQLRAPKGRGKIKVTCNKCHHQFIKKV